MAIPDPVMPMGVMGVLKAMEVAMRMTTRLTVLPTAWATGVTNPRTLKATAQGDVQHRRSQPRFLVWRGEQHGGDRMGIGLHD